MSAAALRPNDGTVKMPVDCPACGTRNRGNAMFCSGCAGQLPGFAPSGPSELERIKSFSAWQLSRDSTRAPLSLIHI